MKRRDESNVLLQIINEEKQEPLKTRLLNLSKSTVSTFRSLQRTQKLLPMSLKVILKTNSDLVETSIKEERKSILSFKLFSKNSTKLSKKSKKKITKLFVKTSPNMLKTRP